MSNVSKFLLTLACALLAFSANAQSIKSLLQKPGDPVAGNPHGKVTIVEFFDYQCFHCAKMAPIIANIIRNNPNVRFVFKEYPIRGDLSFYAARAALAANMQGKYYRFNHALMSNYDYLTKASIFDIAGRNGLDVAKLKKDMQSPAITQQLRANAALASALGVSGTPAFFIGNTNASSFNQLDYEFGEMSQGELQNAINHEMKRN